VRAEQSLPKFRHSVLVGIGESDFDMDGIQEL
jgi:hypothetical protein